MFPDIEKVQIEKFGHKELAAYWLTALGGNIQQNIYSMLSSLFFEVASRCIIKEDTLSYELLCKHLVEVLNDWRKLAEGKTVKMLSLFGLSGFAVKDELFIECENGVIRKPKKMELTMLLEYDYPPQLIFESFVEIKLNIVGKNCPP